MQKHILDVGSSTLKLYTYDGKRLTDGKQESVYFKKHLDEGRVSDNDLAKLEHFILDSKVQPQNLRVFATSFFRKLDQDERERVVEHIFSKTGHITNIIDQTTENIFLQLALTRNLTSQETFLVINIGGGSTELVVLKSHKKVKSYNVDIGVVDILQKYKGINDPLSKVAIDDIVKHVKTLLPKNPESIEFSFQTGGELTYTQITDYNLVENTLFKDENHPSVIDMNSYVQRNKETFTKVPLKELEALMPENPSWMHGARAYCGIAQAICEHFHVETIVPSDVNMAHGIAHYLWGY